MQYFSLVEFCISRFGLWSDIPLSWQSVFFSNSFLFWFRSAFPPCCFHFAVAKLQQLARLGL
jgi:hypothetical protein